MLDISSGVIRVAARIGAAIVSLRPILTGSSDQEIVEYNSIGRAAQLLEEFLPSKSSRDASQCLQLRTFILF